jgi:hypothetical protein
MATRIGLAAVGREVVVVLSSIIPRIIGIFELISRSVRIVTW